MFKKNSEHESGLVRQYTSNVKGKRPGLKKRMRIKANGGQWLPKDHHLDRKRRKCYPRGKVFERMVIVMTVEYMQSN